jgi:ribosomal-protein-alanine N-acetyltransferase
MMPVIRRGGTQDLETVEAIQYCSPEAVHWDAAGYLDHDFWVAVVGKVVAGFLVARRVAPDEGEVLNLAVSPEFRRKGIARALFQAAHTQLSGTIFLEVRESNLAALALYKSLGFKEVSRRPGYYHSPLETAIVMKFHSC